MKLTIEEANKHKCPSPVQCCASHGFIEGWNQALDKVAWIIENSNSLASNNGFGKDGFGNEIKIITLNLKVNS